MLNWFHVLTVIVIATLTMGPMALAGYWAEIYGDEIGRALRYCIFAGWAVRTENGRLRITETGGREYELERRETATMALRSKRLI